MGMSCHVHSTIAFVSSSTTMSKRPIWFVPVPACAMSTPFTCSGWSSMVCECPPMIMSTPHAGSSMRGELLVRLEADVREQDGEVDVVVLVGVADPPDLGGGLLEVDERADELVELDARR